MIRWYGVTTDDARCPQIWLEILDLEIVDHSEFRLSDDSFLFSQRDAENFAPTIDGERRTGQGTGQASFIFGK
jgi:hypothetical protein